MKKSILLAAAISVAGCAYGQLSTNPDKFLGNITTRGSVNGGGIEYSTLWNQITPENESKWASIEGRRDSYSWGGCDNAYNYAKSHNFPFKFHTLVWGSQYPSWMDDLSSDEQYAEIVEWMDEVKKRYPDLAMIDVVNEAVPGHAPAPYKNALGGDGKTGYDWIIKAFELAAERWPNAILIYNDYNTFQWQKNEFIQLVKTLRDAGAPIDAYGCQSHDLTDIAFSTFKSAMTEIQNKLKIPMYSTEYDIGTTDDEKQYKQYKDQIQYMWEQDYVAGITLWGYIYGATWTTDGNSGIIRNGQDRKAMTWLREYMASDAAKAAKSPFPGMKKECSLYIKPKALSIPVDEETTFDITARLRTKTIEKVEFYYNNSLVSTMTKAPFTVKYTPTKLGAVSLKAIVYATDGSTYQRQGDITVSPARTPFNGVITIPGTIEAEDFDKCAEGASYHDSDTKNEGGSSYRTDAPGVDISNANGGHVVGYTATGEWLEYTVNVTENGRYTYEAVVSSGSDGSGFSLTKIEENGTNLELAHVDVPNTGSWDTYTTVKGSLSKRLTTGQQTFRITITGPYVNIDKISLISTRANGIEQITTIEGGKFNVYGADGMYIGTIDVEELKEVHEKVRELTGKKGLFMLKDQQGNTLKIRE